MVVLLGLQTISRWRQRIVFSNGSWLTVRRVTFGMDHVYYDQPVRRAIAMVVPEQAWARFAAKFPRLVSRCRIREANECVHGVFPSLAAFGEFKLEHSENRFWEFTAVDAKGKESSPMETPYMDKAHGVRATCVLACGQNPPTNWPILLHIYERNPTNGQRVLMAKLPARRTRQ